MQYINKEILKILLRVKDLLPLERKMREDRNEVVPGSGNGKGFSRAVTRPWKPMPSIRKFEIHLAVYDWLLLLFGLFRRYDSATTLYGWKNGKANLYIDYMFKRLRSQVKRELWKDAARTMATLMNSHAYQCCCLNYVARGWYKTMKYKMVLKTLREVKSLAKSRATEIQFKRVYLEEPTKFRPLGVPTLPWRIYLHMYNNLLTEWRLVSEGDSQHAYLPGRGVITAWEALFEKLEREPNIYEADYEGFFNNVTHSGIEWTLYNFLHMPHSETQFLLKLNRSLVKLQAIDKIKEVERGFPLKADGSINPQARPLMYERMQAPGWDRPTLHIEYLPDRLYLEQALLKKRVGVPQGAPTSCSLATLALRDLESKLNLIIYADDVIYFPIKAEDDHAARLSDLSMGLKVSLKKSRMAKANGKWLVDHIKFLGFKYYPATYNDTLWDSLAPILWKWSLIDLLMLGFPFSSLMYVFTVWSQRRTRHRPRFCASTRNGATLEFSDKESFIMYLNNARTLLLNSSVKQELSGPALVSFLLRNYMKWLMLSNPASLLFEKLTHRKFGIGMLVNKFDRPVMSREAYEKLPVESRLSLRMFGFHLKEWLTPHIALTGWFMSRMQSNSWVSHIEQNFRLRPSKGSWASKEWLRYRLEWGLTDRKILTTFTASSFACHDLLNLSLERRKGYPRYTVT